jgi:hypothetical protein
MLVGEFMCLAVNTVPSSAYAVSYLARYMTNATAAHYAHYAHDGAISGNF